MDERRTEQRNRTNVYCESGVSEGTNELSLTEQLQQSDS